MRTWGAAGPQLREDRTDVLRMVLRRMTLAEGGI